MELPSNLQINSDCEFIPRYKDIKKMGIDDDPMWGKIFAVKFTEAKIFYDVYSNYWGKIFKNVPSEKVFVPKMQPVLDAEE